MKPIDQTSNNCHSACIASILEIQLKEIDFEPTINLDIPENIKEVQKIYLDFQEKKEEQMKKLKIDEIKIGYNYFKKISKEATKTKKILNGEIFVSERKLKKMDKRNRQNSKNEIISAIPTDCYCILSMDMNGDRMGHAVVGFIDNNFEITVKHDPNIKNRNNGKVWNLNEECQSISFIIHT